MTKAAFLGVFCPAPACALLRIVATLSTALCIATDVFFSLHSSLLRRHNLVALLSTLPFTRHSTKRSCGIYQVAENPHHVQIGTIIVNEQRAKMTADSEEKQPFVIEMDRQHAPIGTVTKPQATHVPFAVILPIWFRHASAWFAAGRMGHHARPSAIHLHRTQAHPPLAVQERMRSATSCAVPSPLSYSCASVTHSATFSPPCQTNNKV